VGTYFVLGLPTFFALASIGLVGVFLLRSFDLSPGIAYLTWGIGFPIAIVNVLALLPLPCSVFAFASAQGLRRSPGECFPEMFGRFGRLFPVLAWLSFTCSWSMVLWGLPLLALWPRMCMAPMVALFETQRGVFKRSRRLMHEDQAIFVLAGSACSDAVWPGWSFSHGCCSSRTCSGRRGPRS
jgi:hypothetical protein